MTIHKRSLLRAGLSISAALAGRASGITTAAEAEACDRPSVAGELSCEAAVIAAAADDFGHIIRQRPQAVLKPISAPDIARLIRWAGMRGLKVAARGQGHSTYGRATAAGGVVLDMTSMRTIHHVHSDRAVVDAGATWSAVLDTTLAHGLTPPVLPNYLDLSVGGTLAVGGIGGTTFRHGMVADNVLELQVVTGDGHERTCSAQANADLFDAVRAGLGQCAVITRATLRLVPAPERVRRCQLFYRDLGALSADQRTVLADGRFDALQGAIIGDGAGGWRYQLEGLAFYSGPSAAADNAILSGLSDERSAAAIVDATYVEDVHALAQLEQRLRSNGQWFNPHPWLLTFLPGSNAEPIASELLKGLTNADVGAFGRITYYPLRTTSVRAPLVRMPEEDIAFPFNLIRIPASDDRAEAERMVADNRALYERIRGAGGVKYPVSALPMSPADWKQHFGANWQLLHDAKRRYDPLGMLTPGYDVF